TLFKCLCSFGEISSSQFLPSLIKCTIRRSTETGIAMEMKNRVTRQGSKDSNRGSTNSNSLSSPPHALGLGSQFSDFLDGLGPAPDCRQANTSYTPMGDVHVGMVDRGGQLEVEVNQNIPGTVSWLHLVAKKKTKVMKKTLDPTYQQPLLFDESPQGKVLQVRDSCLPSIFFSFLSFIIFIHIDVGDYGRMDHKCFMGMAQILLEDLDFSATVSGWYKLFPTSSLADPSTDPSPDAHTHTHTHTHTHITTSPCGSTQEDT
uniref:C2 domain-containing protein n=1 Tax=Scophthalmus maximus TaxID=52904 RepID=A0A8D3BZE8_SCOMX